MIFDLFSPQFAMTLTQHGAENYMTDIEFLQLELARWLPGPVRARQLDGEAYYLGVQDVREKKRTVMGELGDPVELKALPNNKLVDNQFAKLVDQKASYLLGKPITFESNNKDLQAILDEVFDSDFQSRLLMAGTYSVWGGIAWVYLYFDQENKPKFQFFKPYEVLPFWNDAEHTDLDCAARVYLVEGYEGGVPKVWHKCEIFTHNGISRFDLDGAALTADVDNPGGYYARQGDENFRFKDGKIPLIPLKFNYYEQPLISRVKGLQDAYNQILSSFADRTEEDIHSTILVIKNYDGEDLAGFRQNLATYGAIKVRSVNGEADSGVDTLRIEVNTENFQVVLQCLKKAIIENGRGYDAKDDRIGSNANQMNIKSMYMDIDLDASLMQNCFTQALEKIIRFVCERRGVAYEPVRITFNRDQIINAAEVIQLLQGLGVRVSNRTLLGQLPFVADVDEEEQRLKKEDDEMEIYKDGFPAQNSARSRVNEAE